MAELNSGDGVGVHERTFSNILLAGKKRNRNIIQTAAKHHIQSGYVR